MKPIRKRLLLTPSKSQTRGSLFIPENVIDNTGTCLVVEVSDDLDIPVKKGDVVVCQTTAGNRNSIQKGVFVANQNQIYAVIANKSVFPIGKTILIKRDLGSIESGNIVIPENRRMQSLGGWIHRIGISRKAFTNANQGSYVLLNKWESHMIEVELEDRSYGLIVKDSDLLAEIKPNTKIEHQGKIYKP
jgi:co-chaperonin GroES (HSP10)